MGARSSRKHSGMIGLPRRVTGLQGEGALFQPSSFNFHSSRSGFTLMELVIVLFILGLITAIAMPTFVNFYRKTEEQYTTRQLTQLLRFAHQQAIFKRKVRTVGIDFDTNTYYLKADPIPGDYSFEIRRRHHTALPEGFEFESIVYPDREEEEHSDEAFVNFRPDGTADKIKLTIRRVNDRGFTENVYVLRVNGVTGHIKVKEKRYDEQSYF